LTKIQTTCYWTLVLRLPLAVLLLGVCAVSAQAPPNSPSRPAPTNAGAAQAASADSDTVRLQFPNAEVKGVLEFYERLTKKHLVLDNQVQGTVNIVVAGEISREEAIQIIEINLLLNGFTLVPVERSDIVKVIGIGKNPRAAAVPIIADELLLPDGEQVVTFLAKLQYIDPQELQQTLSTFVVANQSSYTNLTALPKSRAILITENTATIRGLLRVIHEIDVPPAEVVSEFIPLERADAKDLLEKLTAIFEKPEEKGKTTSTPRTVPRPPATTPEGNPLPAGATAEMTAANSLEIRGGALSEDSIIIGKIKLTADVRTNRIHIVTRPVNLPFVRKLIHEFDSVVKFGEPTARPLRYVSAGDVLDVIVKAITEPGTKEETSSSQKTTGTSSKNTSSGSFNSTNTGAGGSGSGVNIAEGLSTEAVDTTPEARVIGTSKIIADKNANAIIIIGNDDVKSKVLRLLDELDQRIPQVMLHTVIGELSLDDKDQFGVDYILRKNGLGVSPLTFNAANGASTTATGASSSTGTGAAAAAASAPSGTAGTTGTAATGGNNPSSFVGFSGASPQLNLGNLLDLSKVTQVAAAGGSGLTGFLSAGNSLNAIVTALNNTNHFHVVSRPSVFTRNNKKALIVSGQNIAVPTSIQSALSATGTNGIVTNSAVQYMTVAIQLEVVPLINSDREVSLDILQKEDEVAGSTTIDNNVIPTIATRYLKTSVSIPNLSTLVLGGLIQASQNTTASGIPFLSKIPLLGYLFSNTTKEKIRTELVILISPEVSWAPPDMKKIREHSQKYLQLEPDLEATIVPKAPRKKTVQSKLFRKPPMETRDSKDSTKNQSDLPQATH